MPTFLFLQKFVAGVPAAIPFDELTDLLVEVGPVRPEGDVHAVQLPPDRYAANCTLIGTAESGIFCVGFESPLYSDELRRLVWKCIRRFGCAAFSDCLERVYVGHDTQAGLPEAILEASPLAVRRIRSAQQLWPDSLSFPQSGPDRPALIHRRPGESEGRFQMLDRLGSGDRELCCDLTLHPAACTPGSLAVVIAMSRRVADALDANGEEFTLFYVFRHNETLLQVLEAGPPPLPKVGKVLLVESGARLENVQPLVNDRKVLIVHSGDQLLVGDRRPVAPTFIADREVFTSAHMQAGDLTTEMAARGLKLDATQSTIADLDRLLDEQHRIDAEMRQGSAAGDYLANADAVRWAIAAGCYLGILVSRHIGGQWGYVTLAGERLPVVRTHGGGLCQPHLQVLDHIINGSESSVYTWFEKMAKSNGSATKREDDLACNIPGFCQTLLGKARFAGEGGLPLEAEIPRQQLDFSVDSLRHLDRYLDRVAANIKQLEYEPLSNLELAAGAYLGEVVRSSASDKSMWLWVNYADFARANPGFSDKRPWHRNMRVFLDSAENTTYPLAQINLRLTDPQAPSAWQFARKLLGEAATPDSPAPAAAQAAPVTAAAAAYVPDPALAHRRPRSRVEEGYLWFQEKNYDKARAAWEGAAQAGDAGGQHGLGMLYEEGLGVSKDAARALHYYELAAAQNHVRGRDALARIQGKGSGDRGLASGAARISQADIEGWQQLAVEGFKARRKESAIRQSLGKSGCPADFNKEILEYGRVKVRLLRRVEGAAVIVTGVILLYLTRSLVNSDVSITSKLITGLVAAGLTAYGAYKLVTGERGRF